MTITWQIRLALYAAAALGLMALAWYADSQLKAHYQAPVLAKLQTAETERDGWKANAEDAEKKRAELNKKLLARDVFDRNVRAQIEKVASDLEQLKNQKPDVKAWADSPVPADVISLLMAKTLATTPASVQGGRSTETTSGRTGQAPTGRNEPNPT